MSEAPSHDQPSLAMPLYEAESEADDVALGAGRSEHSSTVAPTTSGGFAIPAATSGSQDEADDTEHTHGDVTSVVVGEDLAERLSVASLLRNFEALLTDVDYRDAFEIMEIGSLQFARRKRLRRELQALYIGLWRLALKRSFPSDYAAVFHAYMEQLSGQGKSRAGAGVNTELVLQYVDKLREHGDNDFSAVSRHMLSLLEFDDSQTRALTLKIALHLRRVYKYFFDHLL